MSRIYSPRNETDLAFLRALLDGEGIPYFVQNNYFGSLYVGPRVPLFNVKTIVVADQDVEHAERLVQEFVELSPEPPRTSRERIRYVIEYLLFAWFIPGRKRKKADTDARHEAEGDV